MASLYTREELLRMAVRVEESAQAFYVAGARSVPELRTVFEHLAADEARHVETYRGLLAGQTPAPKGAERETANLRLKQLASLGLVDHLILADHMAKEAKSKAEFLEAAVSVEKDKLLFYYSMLFMLGEEDRRMVYEIIGSEQSHLAEVMSLTK